MFFPSILSREIFEKMVKFDPKVITEEERIRTGLTPAPSTDLPMGSPPPNAPQFSPEAKPPPPMRKKKNSEVPPPPPRSDFAQPPEDAPPLTKQQRQVREGMNFHLYRPSVWEVASSFYGWTDPKTMSPPFFPLPKGWFFEHAP